MMLHSKPGDFLNSMCYHLILVTESNLKSK